MDTRTRSNEFIRYDSIGEWDEETFRFTLHPDLLDSKFLVRSKLAPKVQKWCDHNDVRCTLDPNSRRMVVQANGTSVAFVDFIFYEISDVAIFKLKWMLDE